MNYDPTSPEQWEDPAPVYAWLREHDPVHHCEKFGIWVVTRHADVLAILRDTERFSSKDANTALADATPPEVAEVLSEAHPEVDALLTADPPVHRRHRGMINRALTQRRINEQLGAMRRIAHGLVDAFADGGSADLIERFAIPYPLHVIAGILDLPEERLADLKRWSSDFVRRFSPDLSIEQRVACARGFIAFQRYFEARIREAQERPGDDFMGDFVRAGTEGGEPLSMPEMLTTIMQTVVAGHETTTSLIGSALVLLLREPELRESLTAAPECLPAFVEEVVRLESPVQGLFRTTTCDVELHGKTLPAGAHVQLMFASANRDPEAIANPDAVDLERANPRRHLGYGEGIHFCPGAPLARSDTRVALEVLLERLPQLRLAPDTRLRHAPHFFLRGWEAVPVTWATG
ncbi:MAG: cytochrome P450 [Myxococcota bacterium]